MYNIFQRRDGYWSLGIINQRELVVDKWIAKGNVYEPQEFASYLTIRSL